MAVRLAINVAVAALVAAGMFLQLEEPKGPPPAPCGWCVADPANEHLVHYPTPAWMNEPAEPIPADGTVR